MEIKPVEKIRNYKIHYEKEHCIGFVPLDPKALEMTAKEMFEELGYELIANIDIKHIIRDNDLRFDKNIIKAYEYYDERFSSYTYILFLDNNTMLKWNYSHQRVMFIKFEELKAINKQVEELGRNND